MADRMNSIDLHGECSLHEEYGGGSLRTFLARIIEGDPRGGARVDLSLDLWPKALSLNGSPPSSLSNITKVTMELPRCGRAGNQENGWRHLKERSFTGAQAR